MSVYAIGDLHLSLGTDKPMDVFGGDWDNYVEKIKSGFSVLGQDDVCVICGDVSWAMSLEESLEDFRFIDALPGEKIILKGNHDYWWITVKKMTDFFEKNGIKSVRILNNNCYFHDGAAICGTRGWLTEGGSDTEHNQKIMARETSRLRASLMAAGDAEVKLCFFHYPPRFKDMVFQDMIAVMEEYGIKNCWYGHIHGSGRKYAVRGVVGGIGYEMVSADFVDFVPQRIIYK